MGEPSGRRLRACPVHAPASLLPSESIQSFYHLQTQSWVGGCRGISQAPPRVPTGQGSVCKGKPQLTPRILRGSVLHKTGLKASFNASYLLLHIQKSQQSPKPYSWDHAPGHTLPCPAQPPPRPGPSAQRAAPVPGRRCTSSAARRGWPAGTSGGSHPGPELHP